MLALIKAWLKVPIIEEEHDGPRRTSGGKDGKMGVPQGGVISPLLANIYINRLLKAWRRWGIGARYQARIINYADDFVILSQGRGTEALAWIRRILDKLGLTLNEAKTRVVNAECASFNFLGYTSGIQRGSKDGHPYMGAIPSAKSLKRIKANVKNLLGPWNTHPIDRVVTELNLRLKGWMNYFSYGSLRKTAFAVRKYVRDRMRNFLRRRHKVPGRGYGRFGPVHVFKVLGVVCPREYMQTPPARA